MTYAELFETKTGADFAVFGEQNKVVWLVALHSPELNKLSVLDIPQKVCEEIDQGWPGYSIVYSDVEGSWTVLLKKGGKHSGEPVEFLGCREYTGLVPTEKEISAWRSRYFARQEANLLSAEDAAYLLTCAMRLVNDIGAGKHSGKRSTTELSANVQRTVSDALADLDWTNVEAMKVARKRIKELCDSEPDLMRSYEALWAFGEGA